MESNKPKINLHNILSYIEGNIQLGLEQLNLQPEHLQEQISYRRLVCEDTCGKVGTVENGPNHCQYCGCDFKGKTSVTESCNSGEKFPDLMSKMDWINFKKENDIE